MVSGVMFSVTCGNTTFCVCECLRNVNVAIKSAVCDYNCSLFVLIVSDFFYFRFYFSVISQVIQEILRIRQSQLFHFNSISRAALTLCLFYLRSECITGLSEILVLLLVESMHLRKTAEGFFFLKVTIHIHGI